MVACPIELGQVSARIVGVCMSLVWNQSYNCWVHFNYKFHSVHRMMVMKTCCIHCWRMTWNEWRIFMGLRQLVTGQCKFLYSVIGQKLLLPYEVFPGKVLNTKTKRSNFFSKEKQDCASVFLSFLVSQKLFYVLFPQRTCRRCLLCSFSSCLNLCNLRLGVFYLMWIKLIFSYQYKLISYSLAICWACLIQIIFCCRQYWCGTFILHGNTRRM